MTPEQHAREKTDSLENVSAERPHTDKRNRTRREFIKAAGAAFTGAAALPRMLAGQALSGASLGNHTPTPVPKIRGMMVDAARLPETLDYYRRVVEFCSEWELNTLQFRLTDDQGTAMRFSSVPNLVTHQHAFTPEQLKQLVDYGKTHGVDLLPEVEAFGHTGYITRSPAYAHLLDRDPNGSSTFTGIIPVHPETLELMGKLFREVATIFPSKYLHGGCDEVNWGGSEQSRKALEVKPRAQIWADYLNALNHLSAGLDKEFIVWGDFVLHKEPEILARLDKNIVIMDWNYWDTSAIQFHDALGKVRANGSRGIGAPGLISYRWGPRPGTEQLRNIDAFADAYGGAEDAGSLGVILTNWVPTRYLQNSLWDGFAYGAIAFKDGSVAAQTSGLRWFVERHFGAQWNDGWSEAFDLLYDAAPMHGERGGASPLCMQLQVPYSDEPSLTEVLKKRTPLPNPFMQIRSLFTLVEPTVEKNLPDFQSMLLSVEYLGAMYWRQNLILEHAAAKTIDEPTARQMIEIIAERDRQLARKLNDDWNDGRFVDSRAKTMPIYGLQPKDQLLAQWNRAAAFTESLAAHPDRFYQLLKSARLA